jgi:hypothetical protein
MMHVQRVLATDQTTITAKALLWTFRSFLGSHQLPSELARTSANLNPIQNVDLSEILTHKQRFHPVFTTFQNPLHPLRLSLHSPHPSSPFQQSDMV